jgi:hypothetical protein
MSETLSALSLAPSFVDMAQLTGPLRERAAARLIEAILAYRQSLAGGPPGVVHATVGKA